MESYEEYIARLENYEDAQYKRLLEDQKKIEKELDKHLNNIRTYGYYIIENNIDTGKVEDALKRELDIIKSMLL